MPYEAFERNKKIKAMDATLSALNAEFGVLHRPAPRFQPKTLSRHDLSLRFVNRSLRSDRFSADELETLQKVSRGKGARRLLGR